MTLRRQILLFLLLFALIPLTAVVVFTMPTVINELERFYHQAHLQNLRADFRDIDQHIASRNETVRLLAKLPEPDLLSLRSSDEDFDLEAERKLYLAWLDRVLKDQLDIIELLFFDKNSLPNWRLTRDPVSSNWVEDKASYQPVNSEFLNNSMQLASGRSLAGPIHHLQKKEGPDQLFLRITSPVYELDFKPPAGSVVITIDVGGLAHAYRQTFWVLDSGEYLRTSIATSTSENAFVDFPGLEEMFKNRETALWHLSDSVPIIWIPMFPTSNGDPLWVGRQVDPSPLKAFQNKLMFRVLGIIALLVLAVLIGARLIARKIETYQKELTQTLEQSLSGNQTAKLRIRGPHELRNMNAKLNQLAEKHAANNLELRQHAAELSISNEYKSRFLANVSHELRTPLNSVLLLSKMLENDEEPPLSEEQKQQSRVIHRAGTELKSMIDNILDLSRIEARRCQIHVEKVSLGELLAALIELMLPQFKEKQLELNLSIENAAHKSIVSDTEKISQILKNFLSNALKFTQSGTVLLKLSRDFDNAEQPIKICVTDPGRGIPKEQQKPIFEAFRQADSATNRQFGGTGLGLTISRELARLLSGKITLKSESGKGSTFCLHLPLEIKMDDEKAIYQVESEHNDEIIEPADSNDRQALQIKSDLRSNKLPLIAAPRQPPSDSYANYRAMIIDTDLKDLLALTRLLENQGLEVVGALDEHEAMENFAEEHYDIVISSIALSPSTRDIWNARTENIAIISLSEQNNDSNDATQFDLNKPVDKQQITTLLEQHFSKEV